MFLSICWLLSLLSLERKPYTRNGSCMRQLHGRQIATSTAAGCTRFAFYHSWWAGCQKAACLLTSRLIAFEWLTGRKLDHMSLDSRQHEPLYQHYTPEASQENQCSEHFQSKESLVRTSVVWSLLRLASLSMFAGLRVKSENKR